MYKLKFKPLIKKGWILGVINTGRQMFGWLQQVVPFVYLVPLAAVSGAVMATYLSGPMIKHPPNLFFCAVVLSSWFCGMGAGLLAVFFSVIALDYYFIPPIYALGISLEDAPDIMVFVASAAFVSWLSRQGSRAEDPIWQMPVESNVKVTQKNVASYEPETSLLPENTAQEKLQQPDDNAVPANTWSASVRAYVESSATPCPVQASLFCREGEYWTIQYGGQIARLKATRGLECLAILLVHPGREFHVRELIGPVSPINGPPPHEFQENERTQLTGSLSDIDPILDARAKIEYGRRLKELQRELDDAERLNEPERASRIRQERDCIAEQLALAVGLGGRNRNAASQTERARSAVTKRIKISIQRISEAMPSLGHHLTARVKTGYFCSYTPHPNRPCPWTVRF